MQLKGRWSRWLSRGLLIIGLVGISGCLSFVHPVSQPEPELRQPCTDLPKCCRDHVHVFLMNGIDPVNCGNLTGVRDYLHCLGFNKVYYGQLYHVAWFKKEILCIHRECPEARFVLVGFNLGVNAMNSLAGHLQKDGVQIDLMVYLSGNKGIGVPHTKPDNVAKVVNILPGGKKAERSQRAFAENTRLCDTSHFGAPTHPSTLYRLAEELATLAAAVPAVEPAMPTLPHSPEEAPTPRPVWERPPSPPDEWNFLMPVSHLSRRPE